MAKWKNRRVQMPIPQRIKLYQLFRDGEGNPKVLKEIKDHESVNVAEYTEKYGRSPEFFKFPANVDPGKKLEELEAQHKLKVAREMQARGEAQVQETTHVINALDDLIETWGFDPRKDDEVRLTLEKNEHSSLHRLGEALRLGHVINTYDSPPGILESKAFNRMRGELNPDLKTFLVCHDWFKVLGDAAGEFKLPFENCAFEFKALNRVLIVLVTQNEGEEPKGASYYESGKGEWLRMEVDECWWEQIRATCVMLDAEVATHQVHRIPHKINAKREKAGKVPMYDFHVVDLARRHKSRAAPTTRGEPTGRHVRLHFVRGHWRHYEDHKTWIKWHLRGDPDLGFIDKDYRL